MLLKISHHTKYSYVTPIFPEPQHLYFYPLSRKYLNVNDFKLEVSPKPAGNATRVDIEGNRYQQCWFNELTDSLTIDLEMVLDVQPYNQLDFLVEEQSKTSYNKAVELYLSDKIDLKSDLINWLNDIKELNPTQYIGSLCDEIYNKWGHTTSYVPDLLSPNDCFDSKAASCRDLAWMMIQILRHKNYPARFVSGYSHNPEITGHELHAWVEVWVAGAGWIGLDPSSGLFTTEYYIPVAASYHPVNTLPIQGSYRGGGDSKLDTSVEITLLDE